MSRFEFSRRGQFAVVIGVYAIFNIGLMLGFAHSLLGLNPFGLLGVFLLVSLIGSIAAFFRFCVRLYDVGIRQAIVEVVITVIFVGLLLFNLWCVIDASASV